MFTLSLKIRNAGQQLMLIILGFWLFFFFWRAERRKTILYCLVFVQNDFQFPIIVFLRWLPQNSLNCVDRTILYMQS